MNYYAEIDENGICFAELQTSGTCDKPTMILVDGVGYLGRRWTGTAWEEVT